MIKVPKQGVLAVSLKFRHCRRLCQTLTLTQSITLWAFLSSLGNAPVAVVHRNQKESALRNKRMPGPWRMIDEIIRVSYRYTTLAELDTNVCQLVL